LPISSAPLRQCDLRSVAPHSMPSHGGVLPRPNCLQFEIVPLLESLGLSLKLTQGTLRKGDMVYRTAEPISLAMVLSPPYVPRLLSSTILCVCSIHLPWNVVYPSDFSCFLISLDLASSRSGRCQAGVYSVVSKINVPFVVSLGQIDDGIFQAVILTYSPESFLYTLLPAPLLSCFTGCRFQLDHLPDLSGIIKRCGLHTV